MPRGTPKAKSTGARMRSSPGEIVKPATRAKRQTVESIVEALDISLDDDTPSKRARVPRSEEQAIEQNLGDHFKGWTHTQVDLTIKGGLSLRARLKQDRETWLRDDTFAMGKYYYMRLREEYGDVSPEVVVRIEDASQPENVQLMKCLKKAFAHNRDFEPLSEFCAICPALDQKNTAALYRAMLRISPNAQMENIILIMDILRLTVRLDLHNLFPETFAGVRRHFDKACVRSLLHFKSNEQSARAWWEAHCDVAGVIMPAEAVKTAFACTTDFSDIKQTLLEIVHSSELGEQIFSRALVAAQASDIRNLIKTSVDALQQQDLTKVRVDAARAEFMKSCKDLGHDATANFEKAKIVQVEYRGIRLPISVRTFLQEWTMHTEALLRTIAVDTNVVLPLWCECQLVVQPRPETTIRVEESLVKDCSRARAALRELLEPSAATGDSIRALMKSKQTLTRQYDRHFRVEEALFESMVGEAAERRLMTSIMNCLPRTNRPDTVEGVLQKLNMMADSPILQFYGAGQAALYTSVRGFVLSMQAGRPPLIKNVKLSLVLLATYSRPSGSHEDGTLRGIPAVKVMYKDVIAMDTRGERITCGTLRPLQMFSWVLHDGERAQVARLAAKTIAETAHASEAKEPIDVAVKKTSKKAKKGDSVQSLVSGLFK